MFINKSNKVKTVKIAPNFTVLEKSAISAILSMPNCFSVKIKLAKPLIEPASANPWAPSGLISKNAKIA